jgi:Arc-like DNA binding domain
MSKDTSINTRYPDDVLWDMRKLSEQHERSFNGEVIWALRQYIEQHRKDMAMYTELNTPIDRARRDYIVAQLTATGFDSADRLPEPLTLLDIYRFYGCQDDGDSRARGIYHIVYKAMDTKTDDLTDSTSL